MPIQLFVDDSGGKGQGQDFVLAGLYAEAEAWAAFTAEWQACLDAEPSIAYFKMREAAGLSGEFRLWTESARNEKLLALVTVMNKYASHLVYASMEIAGHAATLATLNKPQNELYFWPFQSIILATAYDLYYQEHQERFDVIFDEQVIFGPRAKVWYPYFRYVVELMYPEILPLLPVDPLFRTDNEFLPLQASDFWAWILRYRNDNVDENDDFDWLLPHLQSIKIAESSIHYDFQKMRGMLQRQLNESMQEVYEKARERFGDLFK